MRVAVIGGTDFIGPAILANLVAARHEVLTIHRGTADPPDLPPCAHAHIDRRDREALARTLREFGAEALIHTCAYSKADAEVAVEVAPRRLVILSSMDVYRAFASAISGIVTDAVPLDESSPVRERRYLYRGQPAPPLRGVEAEAYEKLDVEAVTLAAGATVLRLPVVFGARDHLHREEFILRRVRAGRTRIPFGAGNWMWSRGWVEDIGRAARLATENPAPGEVFNLAEDRAMSMELWARAILAAAGSKAELVRVPDEKVPPDLLLTKAIAQHVIVSSAKAAARLGWKPVDPEASIAASVRWHLDHPPPSDPDFAADDLALG